MSRYSVIIRYSEEDEAFIASVPELPGCMADGNTYEEAAANAKVIISEWLRTAKDMKRAIPKPDLHTSRSGRILLRIPPWLHDALELEARKQGVSLNQYLLSLIAVGQGMRNAANEAAGGDSGVRRQGKSMAGHEGPGPGNKAWGGHIGKPVSRAGLEWYQDSGEKSWDDVRDFHPDGAQTIQMEAGRDND